MTLVEKLKSTSPRSEAVYVPEWETTVYVRAMTYGERQQFSADTKNMDGKDITSALAVIRFTQDENNKSLFTMADMPTVESSDPNVLDRLCMKVFELTSKKNSPLTNDGSVGSQKTSA